MAFPAFSPALSPGDLLIDLRWDFLAWCLRLWPPPGHGNAGASYFSKVSFKDPRPWFRGIRAPRGFINLVTRLRTGHVCTGNTLLVWIGIWMLAVAVARR